MLANVLFFIPVLTGIKITVNWVAKRKGGHVGELFGTTVVFPFACYFINFFSSPEGGDIVASISQVQALYLSSKLAATETIFYLSIPPSS